MDGSTSLKTGDYQNSTTEPLSEKQEEKEGSEKELEKETDAEVKDEFGNRANSPHYGMCIFLFCF